MANFCSIHFKYMYCQHAQVEMYINATHSSLKRTFIIEDSIFDNVNHDHQPYCQNEQP